MAKPETHAAIKAKFPKLNLTKKRLDLIGDKLEPKVTTELTLDALIDSFNEFQPIEDLAKADDRETTLKKNLEEAKKTPPKKKEEKTDDEDDESESEEEKVPADTPAWAKALMKNQKVLNQELTSLKTEKALGTIKGTLKEKLKDIPEIVWADRVMPTKVEDIDAFVEKVTTQYGEHEKKATESGLKALGKPASGTAAAAGGDKKATKEEIAAVVKDIM